jgi:hypothetical protein
VPRRVCTGAASGSPSAARPAGCTTSAPPVSGALRCAPVRSRGNATRRCPSSSRCYSDARGVRVWHARARTSALLRVCRACAASCVRVARLASDLLCVHRRGTTEECTT